MYTDQFITERRYLNGVSAKTLEWYKYSFRAFEGALDSKEAVIKRIAELQATNSNLSINTYLRCINAYFRWLHTEHQKPLLKIPRLKEEQKVLETLSADGIRALLAFKPSGVNSTRAFLIAITILDTGLRASEVLGLTKEECDLDNLIFKVRGKGGKHRLVPFSTELRKQLWRYTQRNVRSLLFGTKNNTKLSVRNLERDFKILGKKIGITGIRFSPHTFRHSFAVSYLRNGGNLEFLRRILGHTTLSTTQKYLRSLGVQDLSAVHNSLSPLSFGR